MMIVRTAAAKTVKRSEVRVKARLWVCMSIQLHISSSPLKLCGDCQDWGSEGYQLWMVSDRQSTEDSAAVDDSAVLNGEAAEMSACQCNSTCLLQLQFVRSVLSVNPCMVRYEQGYSPKHTHTHTHPFNGPFSGTTQVSRYQKGKPIWMLLKQETVSASGIHWAICKSASRSKQITTLAPHHSVSYRPDALPATQPTASKH